MEAGQLIRYIHEHFDQERFKGIEKLQLSPGNNPMLYLTIGGKRFLIRVFEQPQINIDDYDEEI